MFITTKQYKKDFEYLEYVRNYNNKCLEQDNKFLSARISKLEQDIDAIKKYLDIKFIIIPSEYKAVSEKSSDK